LARSDGDQEPKALDVVANLNQFLCSEPFEGKYVQTGTIFRGADGTTNSYWVCVTPACDMVPRKPTSGRWEDDLHPLRPMSAISASAANVSTALKNATRANYIFFVDNDKIRAAEVLPALINQPLNEVMLVDDQAITDPSGNFFVYLIRKEEERPSFGTKIQMRAVAQLRNQYASRLLQATGNHLSRIGVDFENFTT